MRAVLLAVTALAAVACAAAASTTDAEATTRKASTASRPTTRKASTASRPTTARPTAPPHPSCAADAYLVCQDSCREKNYEVLDGFISDLLGVNGQRDVLPDLMKGPTTPPTAGNVTDRRRRGTVPNYVID